MIPMQITNDLKAGNTLEETLIKHGTNLKELFTPTTRKNPTRILDEWTWIRPTKHNTYRVSKTINHKRIEFGTYKTHKDALTVRNELIKVNWDKKYLTNILVKNNIQTGPNGGDRKSMLYKALKEIQGCKVIAWNGYGQHKVIVTLLNTDGHQFNKEFIFPDYKMQGRFVKEIRRRYNES